MPHPGGQGGEEVHGQQQGHHQLDRHGHHEGGNDDGDGRTSRHGCGECRQVSSELEAAFETEQCQPCPNEPSVISCQRWVKRSGWSDPMTCRTEI